MPVTNANAHKILAGKPEEKRPFGKHMRRWYNIKIDLTETVCEGIEWTELAQNIVQWRTLVNTVTNLRII
jgi:hypothetical protein